MLRLIELWLRGPCWVRCASLGVITGSAFALIGCFVIQPQHVQTQTLEAQNKLVSKRIAALRHKVIPLFYSAENEEQRAEIKTLPRFSVMDFVHDSGSELLKWQPEGKPAVLELLLVWEKLPFLFACLSSYSAVVPQGFSVEPQGGKLHLTMALGFIDEP